jgi:hypothetical protein
MEQKAFRRDYPIEIRGGETQIISGTAGQPGSWLIRGRVADDDRLTLVGTGVSIAAAYRGQSFNARFDGRFGASGYEGAGGFGARRCTLAMTRAAT